jgi:Kef-type K+ transport system membrane component KefB
MAGVTSQASSSETVFLCQIVLLLVSGRLLGEAMLRMGQPAVIGQLIAGILLALRYWGSCGREMDFMRRTVGQLIVTSAIIDDTTCWIIMAVTFGIALHRGIDLALLTQSIVGMALFLVVSFTIGRRLVFFLIRWANDTLVSEVPVITTILVIMGIMALITDAIGVHTVLGAFVAGILVGQSPILTRHIDEQLRGLITPFSCRCFSVWRDSMPIFVCWEIRLCCFSQSALSQLPASANSVGRLSAAPSAV